jgi:SAM-dependent methyltransferase
MTEKKKGIWLNLGCGDDLLAGFVNVDRWFTDQHCQTSNKLLSSDLEKEWIWSQSSVDYILARDIIEHLHDKMHTMNEAWRVLKPGGILEIHVPTTDGRAAFQDPTHVSYWNRHSFWYFEAGNIYRERFAESYGIKAAFRVVSEAEFATPDGPRLIIILEAVK